MRRILHSLLGWEYVTLTDFDGEESVSRLRRQTDGLTAKRMGRKIRLLDNGTTKGASFVSRWKPVVFKSRSSVNGDWLIVAAMVTATAATGVLHREKLVPKHSSDLFSCSGPEGRTAGDWACIDEHWTYVAPKPSEPAPPPDCVTSSDGKYKICNRPLLPSENCVGEVTIKGGVATVTACSGNGNIEEWGNARPPGMGPVQFSQALGKIKDMMANATLPTGVQSVPMTIPAGTVITGQNGGGGGSGSDNRYTTTFDGHKCRFNAAHVMFCE